MNPDHYTPRPNIKVGDKVILPVTMEGPPIKLEGTVLKLYPYFYRVEFVVHGAKIHESYSYHGIKGSN